MICLGKKRRVGAWEENRPVAGRQEDAVARADLRKGMAQPTASPLLYVSSCTAAAVNDRHVSLALPPLHPFNPNPPHCQVGHLILVDPYTT